MPKRYFDLFDDVYVPGRWYLDEPTNQSGREVDNIWIFSKGVPVEIADRLRVPAHVPGVPLDFSLTSVGATPIVHEKVASILKQLAPDDVQFFPVDVDSQREPYFLVNVLRLVKCIDDEASAEVQYWKPEDGRPEKVGQYRAVSSMRIDPEMVGDAKVFRTWGWSIALIVSEDIKEALERAGVTGVKFTEVTGPSEVSPEERARNRKFRQLWEQAHSSREAAWRALGRMERESFIPPIAGKRWPSGREAWRVIHRPGGHVLVVTDGLSAPFYEQTEPSVGFGLELALETDASVQDAEKSWPLRLLERVGDELAEHAHLREQLKTGTLSMEVSGRGLPESLVTQEGRAGVLLGVKSKTLPSHFATPAGDVRLVTVKVLLPAELAYLVQHGKAGRDELVRRFAQDEAGHLSRASRAPVVRLPPASDT